MCSSQLSLVLGHMCLMSVSANSGLWFLNGGVKHVQGQLRSQLGYRHSQAV
jgi:hypothetical protein